MHLIQILLPLADNAGRRFKGEAYGQVRSELAERFGGITSFTRAPAEGVWKEGSHTTHDDIVVFEVMARELDHSWWEPYRAELERRFDQEAIVIRAIRVEML
ncbi:hypothetical protein [Microvirga splendida]|uniref:DUF1330 domain-containing protein n=1 Tax=Microvirga splendida TaxID=2795727 RepID=A0ABS0XWQ2_9HYPH|nr:hypothetical protein [Microvirga splendida]MBJ6124160.1 hypothetical protein [Microvirga splendida]